MARPYTIAKEDASTVWQSDRPHHWMVLRFGIVVEQGLRTKREALDRRRDWEDHQPVMVRLRETGEEAKVIRVNPTTLTVETERGLWYWPRNGCDDLNPGGIYWGNVQPAPVPLPDPQDEY